MQEKLFECLTIEATINKSKYLLSNIYRSPNDPGRNANDHLNEFIEILDNHLSNLSLCNANTYVFLDSNINLLKVNHSTNCQLYLETVYSNGFSQIIGKATRIDGNTYLLIDHILVKSNDVISKSGTLITDFSDHFTNFCCVKKPCKNNSPNFVYKRNMSVANIDNFKESLRMLRWANVINNNDANLCFDNFWNDFSVLYDLHFPLRKIKFNVNYHKIKSYMTTGLLTSRRKKLDLQKKALLNPDMYSAMYRNYRNMYNTVLRASKKLHIDDNFKKFQKNPKKTWDLLKETTFGVKNSQQISEICKDGQPITDKKQIAKEFNEFFATIGKKISDNVPPVDKDPLDFIDDYDPLKLKFTFDIPGPIHVCDIVKSFECKSSTDLDGISTKLLKSIIDVICVPLAHIFKVSLETGVFPNKFKYSRIVPIFKSGDPKSCDNYRPIALVSSISKILEKIVAVRLTNHLQLNDLLYKHQYGFQRNMSTEHNLLHVINFISNSLNNGNYCIGVFLDLKKAFDVCSHDILLKKLTKFGINDLELAWFRNYLLNRYQKVDINGNYSDEKLINISVMQGTILGPILFLCYINDIHTATDLLTFLFADDTSCLAEHKNLHELIEYVNRELKKLANWFRCNKMAVNTSKTKFIIFRTKGKKIPNDVSVVFNNNEIGKEENPSLIINLDRVYNENPNESDRSYKLLGVYLDEFLSFDKHVSHICAKLTRSLYCIRRVSNVLSLKALKSLYYALIHPHLLYCSTILSCTSQANITRIAKLQKKAIRIITKSNATEHTLPLFINLNILPYDKILLYNSLCLMHSIQYNYAPKSFVNMFAQNNARNINYELRNVNELVIPFVRIEWFKRFPLYKLPLMWNNLDPDLSLITNKVSFNFVLRNHMFSLLTPVALNDV
jgi:hypothetical protein